MAERTCTEMLTWEETNNNQISDGFDGSEFCRTPIQEFYAGQKILITGGTGFVGKILIQKLLRSCSHVACLYLIVRPKKDKTVQHRIDELFQDRMFDRLKKEIPKYRDKIIVMQGDIGAEGLGLSNTDRETLINEISIVFHVAATVRFNEKLKLAITTNVRSTSEIIEACKLMRKLKSVVHVSTVYANCNYPSIEERFYTYPMSPEELIELSGKLNNEELEDKLRSIVNMWPNTYTFTKAMAECLVREKSEGLSIGIFRPAIVISSAYEPIKGWIDNLYGATGVAAAAFNGILRVLNCDPNVMGNIVPVDLTVNALIASAWDIYKHTKRKGDDMLIYNYVATVEAPITWFEYVRYNIYYTKKYPTSFIYWYPVCVLIKNKTLFTILNFLYHILPATLGDLALVCVGKKPRIWKMYKRVLTFSELISHFCLRDWEYTNDNVQAMWRRLTPKDQSLFRFSMADLDWKIYFKTYIKGIRVYLFKDELDNLDSCLIKFRRLYWMHQALKTVIFLIGAWIFWNLFYKLLT